MAGAAFGDLGVLLFVAGAVFGDLGVSLFVAGAAFNDVGVSLFVAGTVFGEIWVDSRSAKRCNFQYKMRLRSAKSNHDTSTVSDNFSQILKCNFAWQAQYLVRLEGDACCSAHCK